MDSSSVATLLLPPSGAVVGAATAPESLAGAASGLPDVTGRHAGMRSVRRPCGMAIEEALQVPQ